MKKIAFQTITLLALSTATCQLYASNPECKAKEAIDDVSNSLKKEVERLGNDLVALQKYLESYAWKGIIQDHATSGAETLGQLKLNGHNKLAVVGPQETVHAEVECTLDRNVASLFSVYRVVVGLKGLGPQTTIGTRLGAAGEKSLEKFTLVAPAEPGFYEIRFRTADNILESKALEAWYDHDHEEPDASTTIGILFVKS